MTASTPIVGIIMGSDSDLKIMQAAADILTHFDIPFELTVVSAHRTPERMVTYAETARTRGLQVIIAGAGGAAGAACRGCTRTTVGRAGGDRHRSSCRCCCRCRHRCHGDCDCDVRALPPP